MVVGGGISGLAAAHRLASESAPGTLRVTLVEAGERLGGWVRTETFAGRPVDFGPDSLLVRMPWASELAAEVGIDDQLVAPGEGGAFLLSRGKLRTLPPGILAGLPGGPGPFVRSGLLGPLGLLRAGLDLVLPANAPKGDESIGHLVRRRLGKQALERVIDPLLGGVHAGRCDDLSLQATAPQIAAAARADRSLLRGLRKTAPPPPPEGAAPKPVFMAPRGGMQQFSDAIVAALGNTAGAQVHVRTNARVTAIEPSTDAPAGADALRVHLTDGESLEADGVILAVPAAAAANLLEPYAPTAANLLRELRYASVAHTALAYDPSSIATPLPAGTGFLVPRTEHTLMTACTFLDRKWPERRAVGAEAAAGAQDELASAVVIKCSAGRIDDPRIDDLTDAQLVATLHGELSRILGLRGEPLASRVVRVAHGLPQYEPGHPERIEVVMGEARRALPGLSLAGAAYRGASVPLCIRDGRAAADAQLARLGLAAPQAAATAS